MEQTDNIITIRMRDKLLANNAFADFMQKTESVLNEKAQNDPKAFSKLSASELEQKSVDCMKDICSDYPFRASEIHLVSGHSFPDIVSETYYGVEVKSTQSDHWRSTGSSIIETTRNKNVESIYMLFCKLGGNPEVRCRPYEDCLYDITVTHSPRYLIDMETKSDSTIFAKMKTTYDQLRQSPDSIAQVRKFYRDKAKAENKKEMPWWLEEIESTATNQIGNSTEIGNNMMIRHITSLTSDEKKKLIRQLYILFPNNMIKSNFIDPAMWLVAYHKIVCHNMRDHMTAGGTAKYLNNSKLKKPLPAIVKRFLDFSALIKSEIEYMYCEIDIFNPDLLKKQDVFWAWVEQVDGLLKKQFGNSVNFANWVANGDTLSL